MRALQNGRRSRGETLRPLSLGKYSETIAVFRKKKRQFLFKTMNKKRLFAGFNLTKGACPCGCAEVERVVVLVVVVVVVVVMVLVVMVVVVVVVMVLVVMVVVVVVMVVVVVVMVLVVVMVVMVVVVMVVVVVVWSRGRESGHPGMFTGFSDFRGPLEVFFTSDVDNPETVEGLWCATPDASLCTR